MNPADFYKTVERYAEDIDTEFVRMGNEARHLTDIYTAQIAAAKTTETRLDFVLDRLAFLEKEKKKLAVLA